MSEKMIPESTYRTFAFNARKGSRNFMVSRDWAPVFGFDNLLTIFAQDLCNRMSFRNVHRIYVTENNKKGEEVEREYVMCSSRFLSSRRMGLRWSKKVQERLITKLVAKGYAQVRRLGMPARRYIYLDILKIETKAQKRREEILQREEQRKLRKKQQKRLLPPNGSNKPPPTRLLPPNGSNRTLPNGSNRLPPNGSGKKVTSKKADKEERGKGAGGAAPRNATPPETPNSTGDATTTKQGSSRSTTPSATVQEGNGSGRTGHSPPNNPAPAPKKKEEGLVPNPRRTRKATWRTADTPHAAAARQLHKALRDAGRVTDGKSDDCWSTPLKKVIKSDSDHQKVLDWFCINCSREQTQKHGLPTITNGTQYGKRYEWIRDCWFKAVGKAKGWTRRNGGRCLEGDNDDSEAREEWVS